MSKQIEAIEILLGHPLFKRFLGPVFDAQLENLHLDRINYGVLSGGEKAAISWAWVIWMDKQAPKSKKDWQEWPGYQLRDPFEGFGVMDETLQEIVLRAYIHRWSVTTRPARGVTMASVKAAIAQGRVAGAVQDPCRSPAAEGSSPPQGSPDPDQAQGEQADEQCPSGPGCLSRGGPR